MIHKYSTFKILKDNYQYDKLYHYTDINNSILILKEGYIKP